MKQKVQLYWFLMWLALSICTAWWKVRGRGQLLKLDLKTVRYLATDRYTSALTDTSKIAKTVIQYWISVFFFNCGKHVNGKHVLTNDWLVRTSYAEWFLVLDPILPINTFSRERCCCKSCGHFWIGKKFRGTETAIKMRPNQPERRKKTVNSFKYKKRTKTEFFCFLQG